MSSKRFEEYVEVYVDLDEWETDELIDEVVSRGQEAIDELKERFNADVVDDRLVHNLFLAYVAKDVRLFDMELKTLFREVLGERV